MITSHFVKRSALGPGSLARVGANRAERLSLASGAGAMRRRMRAPTLAAKQEINIFERARRELNMQVIDADVPGQVAWAVALRSALGKYLAMEQALDAQRTSAAKVQAALTDVLAMADGPAAQAVAKTSSRRPQGPMWQALRTAGHLRCGELESARHIALPPRLPSPYVASPAWPFFLRLLEEMRHQAWPPDVRAWFEALVPVVEAYLAAEACFAQHAPTAIAVASLREVVAEALRKIDPPPYQAVRDVPLRVQLHWKSESSKRMLTDTVALCRCTLLLRQTELAEMADLF